jgi:hypothetical protein
MFGQAMFFNTYFFLYLFAPKTAHRVVGYLEEEAVVSYTGYLEQVDNGTVENVPAPKIAIDYWQLAPDCPPARRDHRRARRRGQAPRRQPRLCRRTLATGASKRSVP